MRSHASRICSACAVSMTSDEVMPKCSQRADGADLLGHGRRERDDVVLGDLFDFFDASDVEGAALADVARGFGRDDAGGRHGLGGRRFDEQPGLVPALVAPDAPHFRVGVAWIIGVLSEDTLKRNRAGSETSDAVVSSGVAVCVVNRTLL